MPTDAKAHYNLGLAFLNNGDRSNAMIEYATLKGIDDTLASKLFKILETPATQNNVSLTALHYAKGISLSQSGLYNEALNEFTLSIEGNENKPEAYLWRGGILNEKREFEGALYNLNQAAKLGVNSWELFYWRANIFSNQKEFKLVVQDLKDALALLPESKGEIRKDIQSRINLVQSALDIPVAGDFLADPNKKPNSTIGSNPSSKYAPNSSYIPIENNITPSPLPRTKEKQTCSFCRGTGEGMKCFSCDGTGIKMENCYACNGSGRGYSGNKCLSCNGRGFKNTRCSFCNGKGYKPCTHCNGRGIE